MKMNQATSAEDFKLVSSFESLRKTLSQDRYEDRMDQPLAFWALPSDRRLPLAFLGRTIGDLLQTPFNDLNSTPGIGHKKISSLIKLLVRATKDEPPAVPFGLNDRDVIESPKADEAAPHPGLTVGEKFDPAIVSEALWVQWRETVRKADIGDVRLGRLSPALQDLPTVIWNTPIGTYLDRTIDEIRNMKTHGEKRVRVVLEVFCLVHQMLANVGSEDHLAVRLMPKFAIPIENWIREMLDREASPTVNEVREQLTRRLLVQMESDTSKTTLELACGRLGIEGPPQSVRIQSRQLGVTRARVYQLLDDCSKVALVRWPEGQMQIKMLAEKMTRDGADREAVELFDATSELFFPRKYEQDFDGRSELD